MNGFFKNKNVLVTGGAGFIGSNLTDALLASGANVTVLDNFSTGKRENLADAFKNPAFTLIEGDIRDYETCLKAVKGKDVVYHEAALGSVPLSVKDPMTSAAVNIFGFVNMLFAAKEAGLKRFVYASSSSVYGDDQTFPKVEEKLGRQLSPYAITKFVDELYAANFKDLYGIDTVGLRYFNVYGRRQDPFGAYAAVIPKFAIDFIKHTSPVINGDGSFSRDFTYVDDVVQANFLAAQVTDPAALNTAYNVAYGERTTLNELFNALKTELAVFDPAIGSLEPSYGPFREGDIPHSLASIDRIKSRLGYVPGFNVAEGLHRAAEWYFKNL